MSSDYQLKKPLSIAIQHDELMDKLSDVAIITDVMGEPHEPVVVNVTYEIPEGFGPHTGIYLFSPDVKKDVAISDILHFQAYKLMSMEDLVKGLIS